MGVLNIGKTITYQSIAIRAQPLLFFIIILLVPLLHACTTFQAFPQRALPGETIVIGLGSPNGMTKSNTTVTYTPQGGSPIDITSNVRAMFKLYPDPNSDVWINDNNVKLIDIWTGHGPWTLVTAIDLPTTLSAGPGILNFNSPASYAPLVDHINNIDINLEILAGTPVTPGTFDYSGINGIASAGDLSLLEPLSRITVKAPNPNATFPTYGAVEVTLNVPNIGFFPEDNVKVIVDHKSTFAIDHGGSSIWIRNGDDIKVFFVSPTGKLQFTDIYFSVLPDLAGGIVTQANYYDVDGNIISGPTLSVTTSDIN